jgi:mRNA interferase MazF
MGKFVVGDVIIISFPFSDLSGQKLRPALVVASAEFDNLILCQITSKPYTSRLAIEIESSDFAHGALPIKSYIRPDKIFTAEPTIIRKTVGTLDHQVIQAVLQKVQAQFTIKS